MEGSASLSTKAYGKKSDKGRRVWSTKEEDALIVGLKDHVNKGLKSDNGFRCGYLMLLEEHMRKTFLGIDIRGTPHINSKIHVWKKNYSSLFSILSTSGIGWNETDKMIDAPDAEWETITKIDPNARAMRTKSWPYYDDWCDIFGKDRATGQQSVGFVDAVQELFSHTQGNSEVDIEIGLEDLFRSDPTEEPYESGSATKPNIEVSEKKSSKKRKRVQDRNDDLVDAMKQFTDRADSRLGDIAKCLKSAFDITDATDEVCAALDCIEWLPREAKVFVAKKLVNNPHELKLFHKLSDDDKEIMVKMLLSG